MQHKNRHHWKNYMNNPELEKQQLRGRIWGGIILVGIGGVFLAKTLGVSKSTLISWSKDLSMAIDNERNVAMDAIYEKHKLAKQHQMEMLGIQLSKVREELEKRDLAEVSTDKLVSMQLKLLDAVNSNGVSVTFKGVWPSSARRLSKKPCKACFDAA